MSAKETIKEILTKENIKIIELAEMLNTSQPNLSKKLNTDSIRYRDMEDIAKLLNYNINWIKINSNINQFTNDLDELTKELIHNFNKLTRDDKLKIIRRIEEIASKSQNDMGKSSNSRKSG